VLCFRDPAETGRKREILHVLARGAELLAAAARRDRAPGQAGRPRDRPGSTPVEEHGPTPAGSEMAADRVGNDDAAMRLWILT